MRSPEDQAKHREQRWLHKNPGKGPYPGKFTPAMISELHSGKVRSELSRERQKESVRGGIKDEDCPTIVPGSRTEQVIIGSLLGDGSIVPGGRFREKHANEQGEIITELVRLFELFYKFKEVASGEILLRTKTHLSNHHKKKYNLEKTQYLMSPPRYPIFGQLRSLWYPEVPRGEKVIKRVPPEILNKIGPQALAWWYLGDGTYAKVAGNVRLSSQGFLLEDNLKLVSALQSLGFSSAKVTNRNYIRLDHRDSVDKFLPSISEYIMPSMRYKLGELKPGYKPYNPHRHDPEPIITPRMLGGTLTEMQP